MTERPHTELTEGERYTRAERMCAVLGIKDLRFLVAKLAPEPEKAKGGEVCIACGRPVLVGTRGDGLFDAPRDVPAVCQECIDKTWAEVSQASTKQR